MSDEQQPVNGAERPMGKRALAGVSTTSAEKYAEKRVEKNPETDKPGGGVGSFLPEVATEMKKVIWPTGKEMVQYTLVTFAFLIIITALVWGVDTLTGLGVEAVLAP